MEKNNRERGGVPIRDYTQGKSAALVRPFRGNGLRDSLSRINFDRVARSLVWVSLGLGLAEVLMPRRMQKLAGIRRGNYSGLIRMAGIREVMHGLLILVQGRPHLGVWSRVAGDAMDLGLLGAAFSLPRAKKNQTAIVTGVVAGITLFDIFVAAQLRRRRAKEKRYSALTKADLNNRTRSGAFHVLQTITINAAPNELYQYWRNFENLPNFMQHLQSVRVMDDGRSHWVTKAPAGARVEWDAEITEDVPNETIAWQSTTNAQVPNSGVVRFEPRPEGRGTVVRVEIEYRPPGGAPGRAVASLFGEEPKQQVADDLRRFKQVIETGEVVLSDASLAGVGQKTQRPAQPVPEKYLERMSSADTKELQRERTINRAETS